MSPQNPLTFADTTAPVTVDPIGYVTSPFKEKFAVPRQPGIVGAAKGHIVLRGPYAQADTVRGIEQFSHLWVIFRFHQTCQRGWSPLVRPPRLGGNQKIGVFASRSTFRPNAMGMSVVRLEGVEINGAETKLAISGLDLVDGTPVLDIKPYLPYSDAITQARGGYADTPPPTTMQVSFSTRAATELQLYRDQYPHLAQLIEELLVQDPRPAYKRQQCGRQEYGVGLYEFNVCWQVEGQHSTVTSISPLTPR